MAADLVRKLAALVVLTGFVVPGTGCAGARTTVAADKAEYPISLSRAVRGPDGEIVSNERAVKVGPFRATSTAWGDLLLAWLEGNVGERPGERRLLPRSCACATLRCAPAPDGDAGERAAARGPGRARAGRSSALDDRPAARAPAGEAPARRQATPLEALRRS